VVFRKENKVDTFQRQISALRQQLGTAEEDEESSEDDPERAITPATKNDRTPESYDTPDRGNYAYSGFDLPTPSQDFDSALPEMAVPSIPAVADTHTSVIAFDTVWKGDLQTNGNLHIHGRVDGTLDAKQDIYVAEEADVDATLTATNVIVAGLVKGTIRCHERFEVLPQGRVAGDVQAPTLVVHEGAIMTGQFRMGSAESGTPTDAVPTRPAMVQRRGARGGQ